MRGSNIRLVRDQRSERARYYAYLYICLQVELLVPHGIQFLGHGTRPLLDLADLNGDVGVAGSALVLGYQSLGADNWFLVEARGRVNGRPVNIDTQFIIQGLYKEDAEEIFPFFKYLCVFKIHTESTCVLFLELCQVGGLVSE